MMCHRDAGRDKQHEADRLMTFNTIQSFLDLKLEPLNPPAGDWIELIKDFIFYAQHHIFRVRDRAKDVIAALHSFSDQIKVTNHLPDRSLPLSSVYSESDPAMQLRCQHIFHQQCLRRREEDIQVGCISMSIQCAMCRRECTFP